MVWASTLYRTKSKRFSRHTLQPTWLSWSQDSFCIMASSYLIYLHVWHPSTGYWGRIWSGSGHQSRKLHSVSRRSFSYSHLYWSTTQSRLATDSPAYDVSALWPPALLCKSARSIGRLYTQTCNIKNLTKAVNL